MDKAAVSITEQKIARERRLSRWIITLLLFASTVMVAQGVYNLSNLKEVDESIDAVYQTANQLDALARDVTKPIADMRILSLQLVLSPNSKIAQETENSLNQTIALVQSKLVAIEQRVKSDSQFQSFQMTFENVNTSWQGYLSAIETTKKYQKDGVRVAAFISVTQQEKLAYEALQSSVSNFSTFLLTQSRAVYDEANEKSNLAYITLFVTVIVEILILKFILYFVWRMFRSFIQSTSDYENDLQKERQQLLNTLNASPVGVGVTVGSELVYVNEKLQGLLGVKVGDAIKHSYVDLNDREKLMKQLDNTDVVSHFDVQMNGANGEVLDMINTFYKMEYNDQPAILAWLIDVTDLKEIERKHTEAKKLAEEATQAKSDFLANMSHEIRTPMNAIIGLSELALESDLSTKQYNYINKVHRSAESLLGIINDILDFSKIEAGKLAVERIDFRLEDVLENLGSLLSFRAEEKHLELLFDIPNDLPQALIGDPLRLGQILINLGNNAVKFTEQGEVIISVKVIEQTQTTIELMFEVADTGIGISPDNLTNLFNSFTQADTSTTREFGGTGLGLTISKNLTELMGGEIHCQSEVGKGSTFSFNTKFDVNSADLSSSSVDKVDPMRVLIIDDNPHALDIIENMLKHFGLSVDKTNSGQQGLELIKSADSNNQPYQLIIVDWQMPTLNGIEMTYQLQAETALSIQPKVILVTAYGRETAMEAATKVEFSSFLNKPITHAAMLNAVLIAQGKQELAVIGVTRKAEEVEQALAKIRGAKLLLAEDNEINMELAIDILERHHITVVPAIDGQQAIDKLLVEDVDGILMDCQMPVLDGYKATEKIRTMPKYKNLPIMAMTANAMVGDKEKVIAAGMNDHIAKPIQRRELFLTIAKWVTPKNPLSANQVANKSETNLTIPTIAGVNVSQGIQIFDGNINLYKKLLVKFADQKSQFAKDFTLALDENDEQAAIRLAHTLKGVSANIAAQDVHQAATELEHQCANFDNRASILSALSDVQEALDLVITSIQTSNIAPLPNVLKVKSEIPLSELLAKLMDETEQYDTAALDTLSTIRDTYVDDYKNVIEEISACIDDFNFDEAHELTSRWILEIKS